MATVNVRPTYVVVVDGNVFVWAHGNSVGIYKSDAWERRLAGSHALPVAWVNVTGFEDRDQFAAWCRAYRVPQQS